MVDQTEIHGLVQNEYVNKRKRAVERLEINFAFLIDKEQAWDDLIGLMQDNNHRVRRNAAHALGSCYSHIPEEYKKQTLDDLHRLTQDDNNYVRLDAAGDLGSCYSYERTINEQERTTDEQHELLTKLELKEEIIRILEGRVKDIQSQNGFLIQDHIRISGQLDRLLMPSQEEQKEKGKQWWQFWK